MGRVIDGPDGIGVRIPVEGAHLPLNEIERFA
jgi:hypothetical protein